MKKYIGFIFISIFTVSVSFSAVRGQQEAIKSGHWIYDSLAAVLQDDGIMHFYDHAPLTVQEVNIMLNEVEYEQLSDAGKNEYDRIKNYFNESNWSLGSSKFNLGFEVTASLEGQYKTNNNLDWLFDRRLRNDFIHTDMTINVFDYVFLGCDINIAQSKSARENSSNYINVPYDGNTIDLNFPHDAYMNAGFLFNENCGINFRLSTLNQQLGRSVNSSVILSDNMTDTPAAQLKVFSPWVQYAANITMVGMDRYFYMHNLDIRPHKKVTVSILEGSIPYGKMDLRYMIPFSIFHGYAGWWDYKNVTDSRGEKYDVGTYVGLTVNYVPVKHLRLYMIFALNQFQMPNETDKSIPNGYAAQLGFESYIPINEGFFHLSFDTSYATSYFMINESPNWSFVKTYRETCDNSKTFYEWIGSPYGPDSLVFKLSGGYEVSKKWSVDGYYALIVRGNLSRPDFNGWGGYDYDFYSSGREKLWCHPDKNDAYKNGSSLVSPSGTPEFLNAVSLKGELWPLDWMSISFRPGLSFAINSGNREGNFDIGFEAALTVKCFITRIKDSKKGEE